MSARNVIILGAAGRDFHNFNVVYRDDPSRRVVAFTAAQIPDIEGRVYPATLAGERYPEGIPILAEDDLERLIREHDVHEVVFAYSDVSHEHVMHLASRALASGADYVLLGPKSTALAASKPVVSVCAVRTGCGKSQTTRKVAAILKQAGLRVAVVRHPMPYGDLVRQRVQRFARLEDLDHHRCTIEEREEYEPHIRQGNVVYAGVDYEAILREAEQEADVVLWDGGNNDLPFFVADLEIVVADPHRAGHELRYHPGEANLRRADVVVINKVDTAAPEAVEEVRENVRRVNPGATLILAASPVRVDDPGALQGRRVLVIEDGPTLTHGGMSFGAGVVAARNAGASEIVDPRPFAAGSLRDTYAEYPDTGAVLPAMGYSDAQIADLAESIRRAADAVDAYVIGTPVDLRRLIAFPHPAVRVTYELAEQGKPDLEEVLRSVVERARP